MWSGDKTISPFVEKLMAIDSSNWKRAIAVQFWNVHSQQLNRQWANFTAQYQPVNNYHVVEEVDYDHTGDNEYTDSGSDTKTRSGVIQNYGKIKSTNSAWTYDNQSANVSENETISAVDDDPSTTRYGTGHNDGLVDETEYGKTRTGSESGHDDLTTTKSGNLGITPIAQLLQMDIELWQLNFFTSVFFPLLDKAIALPIY